jgi:hypothetical protein
MAAKPKEQQNIHSAVAEHLVRHIRVTHRDIPSTNGQPCRVARHAHKMPSPRCRRQRVRRDRNDAAQSGRYSPTLRARRSVLDMLDSAERVDRFLDGQEHCRFERAERTAATNRQRNRGH